MCYRHGGIWNCAAAISNLSRDGLQCTFQNNSKLQPLSELDIDITFGESSNELIQLIKKVEAVMIFLGHGLYKGDIYVKPPSAKFTFVLIMNVESYINKLMISDLYGEDVVKLCRKIIEIMCHADCELIRQIKNLIGTLLQLKMDIAFQSADVILLNALLRVKILDTFPPELMHPIMTIKENHPPCISRNRLKIRFQTCLLGLIF